MQRGPFSSGFALTYRRRGADVGDLGDSHDGNCRVRTFEVFSVEIMLLRATINVYHGCKNSADEIGEVIVKMV